MDQAASDLLLIYRKLDIPDDCLTFVSEINVIDKIVIVIINITKLASGSSWSSR